LEKKKKKVASLHAGSCCCWSCRSGGWCFLTRYSAFAVAGKRQTLLSFAGLQLPLLLGCDSYPFLLGCRRGGKKAGVAA